MKGFKRLFKWCAILCLAFEVLYRLINCLYVWYSFPYRTFDTTICEALREIVALLATGYALTVGIWPIISLDRRFGNLIFLLTIQQLIVFWLGDKMSGPEQNLKRSNSKHRNLIKIKANEYDETMYSFPLCLLTGPRITIFSTTGSSPLWLGSVVILCLGLIESLYQDDQDVEPDEFFKCCILGRKEKLKQFTSKHRNMININAKHKGSTALHLAIEGNHLQIVQYLLQTFTTELDLTVTNEDGLYPLDLAIKKKYSCITNVILSDSLGCLFAPRSSLILAVKTGQDKIARTISLLRCKLQLSRRLSKSEFDALPINVFQSYL